MQPQRAVAGGAAAAAAGAAQPATALPPPPAPINTCQLADPHPNPAPVTAAPAAPAAAPHAAPVARSPAGGGAASRAGTLVGTPRSILFSTYDSDEDDGEDQEDEDSSSAGFGKRKIKRTLTRLQRQQRVLANLQAQQAAAAAAAFATPLQTPCGSPQHGAPGGDGLPAPANQVQQQQQPGQHAAAAVAGGTAVVTAAVAPSAGGHGKGHPPPAPAAEGGGKQPHPHPQEDYEEELELLRELMGSSVQGASVWSRMPWFSHTEIRLYCWGLVASLLLYPLVIVMLVGASIKKVERPQIYRLLLFFAGWLPLFLMTSIIVWHVYVAVERIYFKQALCYHGKLRRATTFLCWTFLLLVWFDVAAWVVPCDTGPQCLVRLLRNEASIGKTIWRMLLCMMLFAIAVFVTSVAGRLIGRHFYTTTHHNKVEAVLWKQAWLVLLSSPREQPAGRSTMYKGGKEEEDDGATAQYASGRAERVPPHSLRQRRGFSPSSWFNGASGAGGAAGGGQRSSDQLLPTHSADASLLDAPNGTSGCLGKDPAAAAAAAAPPLVVQEPPTLTGGGVRRSSGSGSGHAPPARLLSTVTEESPGGGSFARRASPLLTRQADAAAQQGDQRHHHHGALLHHHKMHAAAAGKDAAAADDGDDAGAAGADAPRHPWRQHFSNPLAAGAAAEPQGGGAGELPQGRSSRNRRHNWGARAAQVLSAARHGGGSSSKCGSSSAGAAGGAAAAAPWASKDGSVVPDDPLLDAGILEVLGVTLEGKKLDRASFSSKVWARVREGVSIQVYEVLLRRYSPGNSPQVQEHQLRTARRLGKALFAHIRGDASRPHLTRDDFEPFFAGLANAEAEADKAFLFFDKENSAVVTQAEMCARLQEVVQERQDMAASLHDTSNIVKTLEIGIGLALNVMMVLGYLAVWKIDVAKGFSTITAALLFFSFMFSNTAKNVFEATLFLLVAHAYDVGDLICVDGENFRVSKITLLYTTLLRPSGQVVLMPNVRLLSSPLVNLARGNCLAEDSVTVTVDAGPTATAAHAALVAALASHYEANDRLLFSVPGVRFSDVTSGITAGSRPRATLTIFWTNNFPPTQAVLAKRVRSALLQTVQTTLGSLPAWGDGGGDADGAPAAPGGTLTAAGSAAVGGMDENALLINAAVMGAIAATDLSLGDGAGGIAL